MKNIMIVYVMALVMYSCSAECSIMESDCGKTDEAGVLIVEMQHESDHTKSDAGHVAVLDDEKAEYKVEVFVFDKDTGVLGASRRLGSVSEGCSFTMTAGPKMIYVVVNGPDLSDIRTLRQLEQAVDDLSETTIKDDGFTMVGHADCEVVADLVARPLVVVRRLVSRVVLKKVTCSIPSQYGNMHVDCVFLGNAFSRQTLSGKVTDLENSGGYAGHKTDPIGKNGVKGACEDYFYREVDEEIAVGASSVAEYQMYCQPNDTDMFTCVYLLATVDGTQYYYRIPLHNGLEANTTYSVEVELVNLGSLMPPDGDLMKGEIVAEIKMDGWYSGDNYSVRF